MLDGGLKNGGTSVLLLIPAQNTVWGWEHEVGLE